MNPQPAERAPTFQAGRLPLSHLVSVNCESIPLAFLKIKHYFLELCCIFRNDTL
uniref:Uncharacterized protein n=1 Tax=Siphoviridae sp. ct0Go27 TaxID=2827761 RepID=A0A8S5RW99_9CAUD|nr:MAG TPA: hypothetical protein [Siphoviridae sp. ct0Go27]